MPVSVVDPMTGSSLDRLPSAAVVSAALSGDPAGAFTEVDDDGFVQPSISGTLAPAKCSDESAVTAGSTRGVADDRPRVWRLVRESHGRPRLV